MSSFIIKSNMISEDIQAPSLAMAKEYIKNNILTKAILSLSHIEDDQKKNKKTLADALTLAFSYIIDSKYLRTLNSTKEAIDVLLDSNDINEADIALGKIKESLGSLGVELKLEIINNTN